VRRLVDRLLADLLQDLIDGVAPSSSELAVVTGVEKLRTSTGNRAGHRSRRDRFDFRADAQRTGMVPAPV
jgi:hypothetical protein